MNASNVLYHGSPTHGLKAITPSESGFGAKYVYATDSFISAIIFMSRKRNSLQATWEVSKAPSFCERTPGVVDKWYSGLKGSVYVVSLKDFRHDARMEQGEYAASKPVKVKSEIVIDDAKETLLELQREGKLRIVRYKDRTSLFKDDSDLLDMCVSGLEKYGLEFTLRKIRELQPNLEKPFLQRLSELKKT